MDLFDPKKAKALCQKALRGALTAGADAAKAELSATRTGNLRFANNGATTNGDVERHELALEVESGKRHASLTTEDLSEGGLAALAERAVEAMRALPEDAEYPGLVQGPQKYPELTVAYDPQTAEADPKTRAAQAKAAIELAREAGLTAAGYIEHGVTEKTLVGSTGFFGQARSTSGELTVTVRNADGSSSGWAGAGAVKAASLDAEALAKRAVEKAKAWVRPETLPPGKYTVVLEPQAVGALLSFLWWSLNERPAEEGRNAFSKPGGGTKVGEKLFADSVTLLSDPFDSVQPGQPWVSGGAPSDKLVYVEHGVLRQLQRDRYWAQKTGRPAVLGADNLRLEGGQATLDELIAGCERGLLVGHLWYTNLLAPQTITVTGLTRDATFLIENGKLTRPVRNFRFNESLLDMLAKVDGATAVEQSVEGPYAVPGLRVRDFEMASLSESV